MIPVLDLFAGPGGLSEGFASVRDTCGMPRFKIGLSVERDPDAYRTLLLRSFYRQFAGDIPPEYERVQRGDLSVTALLQLFPQEARLAATEVLELELSSSTSAHVRSRVDQAFPRIDPWVLIGGPPCQAYSLIGRSRNRGVKGYDPQTDKRQTLYLEYLQILGDHGPPVFVMENVKGLLSATLDSYRLFDRILDDLRNPAEGLKREGRSNSRQAPKYQIFAFGQRSSLFNEPADFVVRAEEHGIPQARHRVFLLGVREGLIDTVPRTLSRTKPRTVSQTISDLPRLRSGLTDAEDTSAVWVRTLREMRGHAWFKESSMAVRRRMKEALSTLREPRSGRGGEFVRSNRIDTIGACNHSSRAHITSDLGRYLFASCFALEEGRSPTLRDFPPGLRPNHRSVSAALKGSHFADRFRVQRGDCQATTITSHIAKDGHYYIHYDPSQCRSLTVREAARLQTFPDDYLFLGNRTAQFNQVGNAVPPRLAHQIASIVADLF